MTTLALFALQSALLAAAAVGVGEPWQVALATCLLTEAILVSATRTAP